MDSLSNSAQDNCDVVVIGAGPAGSAVARLLALRGHDVFVVAKGPDQSRGLGESLPPSARKALGAIGVLDVVDAAGFCRNRGNTVWWGDTEGRVEEFDGPAGAAGYQVWRPDLDQLLLQCATRAGARFREGTVRDVNLRSDSRVETSFSAVDGQRRSVVSRFVVDCSGRAGVLARHRGRQAHGPRTQAWIGLWEHADGLEGRDLETTMVETYADGWAWSIPVSPTARCATVMIDPDQTRVTGPGSLEHRYLGELGKTRQIGRAAGTGRLQRVWGCDASFYETERLGGPQHLVVGDASCFIDPLSSFGVKKALASAWTGAAVVHTSLQNPELSSAALELFTRHEREIYETSVRQSAAYAAEAHAHHPGGFWKVRSAMATALAADVAAPAVDDAEIRAAFERLKERDDLQLRRSGSARFEWQPAIRGHAVALQRAVVSAAMPRGLRFVENVDVTTLVDLAGERRPVGELFAGYCRAAAPVPLPNFLKALSVLVASHVLEPAEC